MSKRAIQSITAKAVYVSGNDIDTDRIIPARFMKCVTFDDLGQYAFYDVRFNEDGSSKNHPIDQAIHQGAKILISDNNFGCGSSREHAPQALAKHGFTGVIAGNFAEIFFGNCTTLGIPCLSVSDQDRKKLIDFVTAHPEQEITMDIANKKIIAGDLTLSAEIKDSSHQALTSGNFDPLFELLKSKEIVGQRIQDLAY